MEESNEVPSDENKISPEGNKKRILKTPTQINGLENFYNEHKYPTEEQKKQLAQELELTEKQVSGWFCHRRLKDKRLSGKEENTNGHGQDSCGSTKRGSQWHADPKEVESRSTHDQGFLVADPSYNRKSPRLRDATNIDDTSSESSLPLQDRIGSKSSDPFHVKNCKYLTANRVIGTNHAAGAKHREYKPSGYLKVRGEVEHTAVTAVKMRLGRHYCEDGPPLSVHFESVPPGAFTKTVIDSAHETYFVEDSGLPHSPDISRAREEAPINGMNHRAYTAQMKFRDQYVEVENPHAFQNTYGQHNRSQHYSKQSSLNPENPLVGRNFALETNKHAAGDFSAYSHMDKGKTDSRLYVEDFMPDSFSDRHLGPYSGRSTDDPTGHLLYKSDKTSPKIVQTDVLKSKRPRVKLRCTEPFDTRSRGPPKRMHCMQEENPYDKTKFKVSRDQAKKATKGVGNRINRQEPMLKGSAAERPPLANHLKGSWKDMPSSFSEDETADTSSSLN